MRTLLRVIDCFWKLAVSGLAYAVAGMIVAAVVTMAGMHTVAMPPGLSPGKTEALSLALSLLLAVGVAPLASGLSGGYTARWLALALLVFINLGVNTVIEAEIFTSTFANGGEAFLILMDAGASLAFGALLARFFGTAHAAPPDGRLLGVGEWGWRLALAILAFPVIYYTFGSMVAPFVLPSYRAGVAGLVLPKVSVVVPVEIGRSTLYLLGSLPAIILWTRSRRGLVLALGWAGAVTNGLYGLIQAYWFPTVLRVAHSIEVSADSFVYALVIVLLLKPVAGDVARSAPDFSPAPQAGRGTS